MRINLKKNWVRIVISLFVGGAIQESVRIKTGNDDKALLILGAVLFYILLSAGVYIYTSLVLQRKVNQKIKRMMS